MNKSSLGRKRRVRCEDVSSIYRDICNSKYNGKVLEDGRVRVGPNLALNEKGRIEWLKNI